MLLVRQGPYTLRDLAELAGVTDHTARNWRALNLLPLPTVDAAERGGRPAQYGTGEATVMAVLGACHHQGVPRKLLQKVARELRLEVENTRIGQRGFHGLVLVDVTSPRVVLLADVGVKGAMAGLLADLGTWGALAIALEVEAVDETANTS